MRADIWFLDDYKKNFEAYEKELGRMKEKQDEWNAKLKEIRARDGRTHDTGSRMN